MAAAPVALAAEPEADRYWHQWRGPRANGVAPHADPPVEWAEGKNIRWKFEPRGEGNNTPIIWGDTLFILSALKTDRKVEPAAAEAEPASTSRPESGDGERRETRRRRERVGGGESRPEEPRRDRGRRRGAEKPTNVYQWYVIALDRKTGKPLWERMVREQVPHEGTHPDGSMAPTSAITDGKTLFAYFGSRGLFAIDFEGTPLWDNDLGDMNTRNSFGEGGSPALHGDALVINWDHEGESFVVALDKRTGKEMWRKSRDEPTSWSTPLILEHDGRAQVIVSATNRIRAYDLATGEIIWECGGMTGNVIPSPVADFGMVFCMSGFRGNALKAIRYGEAKGDVTGSGQVAWSYDKDTPYVPSPLLYDGTLWFTDQNRAILTCLDAKSGKPHFERQRLEGIDNIYASPLGAAGRVYIAGRDGTVLVLDRVAEFKVLATNKLDDGFDASPVAVDGELYLRGHKALYCVAGD